MEVDQRGRLDESARDAATLFAPVAVEIERRADGATFLRAGSPLARYARCAGEYLSYWANAAPDRDFLLERDAEGAWNGITYRETLERVRRIAASLLHRGLSADRPIIVLS